MIKSPKGIWYQPWSVAALRPEIARLVAQPVIVVSMGRFGGSPLEYVRKTGATVNGSGSTWVDSPYGPAMRFANPASPPTDQITFSSTYPQASTNMVPWSLAALWKPSNTTASHTPWAVGAPSSGIGGTGGASLYGTSSGFQIVHYSVAAFATIGTVVANTWFLQLYSYDLVRLRHLVLNLSSGAIASQDIAETNALSGSGMTPRIGLTHNFDYLQGDVAGVAWVRGAWTLKEMELLARDPIGIWRAESRPMRSRRIIYKAAVGGTTFTANLAGAITSAGAPAKLGGVAKTGTATLAGAVAKVGAKPGAGSIGSGGAPSKATSKAAVGAVTMAGAFASIKVALLALAGSIASAASLARSTSKGAVGAVGVAGVPAKSVTHPTAGTVTSGGGVSRLASKALVGTITAAASIAKSVTKAIAGVIAWAGSVATSGGSAVAEFMGTRCTFMPDDEATTFTVTAARTTFTPTSEHTTFTPYDGAESFTPDP